MPIIPLTDCVEFTAGDHCLLREMIHPDKQNLALRYSLAHATVPAGKSTTPHRLSTSEVYYILQGQGRMHIDDEISDVTVSDTVYIPPHAVQYITNTGEDKLTFVCIVDPAWKDENEVILA
ncbi:MAG: cupin domain-containing protein [Phycisphaeraceae bacterium]|nr:cupin domain-containing protein [Phycisphaeraceae bacterium]